MVGEAMMKQAIHIILTVPDDKQPYELLEWCGPNKPRREALRQFFEDIGYQVDELQIERYNQELTPAQTRIAILLGRGKSSKEIAGLLGISTKTAETHRANLMQRLELHNISELVRWTIRKGLVTP